MVLLEGENGSGKTTLFNIIGFMDDSFDGEYFYFGKQSDDINDKEKARIRHDEISYVFQKNNLVRYLSKGENLSLSEMTIGEKKKFQDNDDWHSFSQGQQEMIALEKGLEPGKKIYLLDEVTANLDSANQKIVIDKIKKLSESSLVIVICHDVNLESLANFIWYIKKGKISLLKGNVDDIDENSRLDNRPKIRSKAKFPFRLMFKRAMSNGIIHIFQIFLYSIIFCFGWAGIAACKGYSLPYLEKATERQQFISVETNTAISGEDILTKFPNDSFVQKAGYIVYSDKVPNDGRVYCNSNSRTYFLDIIKSEKLDVVVDDSIKTNLLFTYESHNGLYEQEPLPSSKEKYCYSLNQNFWNVNGNPGFYYHHNLEQGGVNYISNKNCYQEVIEKSLDLTLEDNVIYVGIPELVTDSKTSFDYVPSDYLNGDTEDDFNKVFPDGIEVKYSSKITNTWYAVVSDNTMDKLIPSFHIPYKIVMNLENDRNSIIKYVAGKGLIASTVNGSLNESFDDYRSIISYNSYKPNLYSYGAFIYSMPILVLILEALFSCGIRRIQLRDDWILKAKGLSKRGLWLIDLIPFISIVIISLLIGLGLAFPLLFSSGAGSLIVSFSPLFSVIWSLAIVILSVMINTLVNFFGEKRHE